MVTTLLTHLNLDIEQAYQELGLTKPSQVKCYIVSLNRSTISVSQRTGEHSQQQQTCYVRCQQHGHLLHYCSDFPCGRIVGTPLQLSHLRSVPTILHWLIQVMWLHFLPINISIPNSVFLSSGVSLVDVYWNTTPTRYAYKMKIISFIFCNYVV